MSYRPYWTRHPIQRRLFAVLTLPITPFIWVVMTLWQERSELVYELKRHIEAINE